MKYFIWFLTNITVLIIVMSCANNKTNDPGPNGDPAIKCLSAVDSAAIAFSKDIAPIISSNCESCHNPNNLNGGYSFKTFQEISGNADKIHDAILGANGRQRMPLGGKLSNCDIEKITTWIKNGKPNN